MSETSDFSRLREILNLEQLGKLFRFFSVVTGLDVGLFDFMGNEILAERKENSICGAAKNHFQCQERISYGGLMSSHLGEPYICSCGCGLIMCFLPIMFNERLIGTIACGPALLWDADEVAIKEFKEKTFNMGLDVKAQEIFKSIVSCDCINMTGAAQILFIIVNSLTREHSKYLDQRAIITGQQAKIAELIIEKKLSRPIEKQKKTAYPIEKEKELIAFVEKGNLEQARITLNTLLGEIFLYSQGKIDTIRVRIFELIAILSRAAVETGAPLEDINRITKGFFKFFIDTGDFENFCLYTRQIVEEFIIRIFKNHEKKQLNVHLSKAIDFISHHHGDELTLQTVSNAIFVSSFYLSHLFRNELNTTFSDYISRFRITKAQDFLRNNKNMRIHEIAEKTGFNDPNYFTKSFKKLAGISPKKYRAFFNNEPVFN